MLHTPITAAPAITLAEAEALHAYAKRRYENLRDTPLPEPTNYLDAQRVLDMVADRRDMVAIFFASAAVIDALNGVPDYWRDLDAHVDEIFEMIEARRDAGSFYAAMRAGVVS